MDKEAVIQVEGLGKRYTLGAASNEPYVALRDVLARGARGLFRRARPAASHSGADAGEFWALRDVSFSVARGEVVGIIGRNGAGKSTLLKVLSRITEPTSGRVRLKGRVASLLEVGTGFHPELTGRENIFLNGAILGMHRAEIRAKFDEIVAFAEVARFLDTPVKRYSSGMYVRLAFAVAAHLEPEILIVDEVLAVGDAEFQKKCLGKMQDIAKGEGRTVLFVSHNLAAVQHLCGSAIYLANGQVQLSSTTSAVIRLYTEKGTQLLRDRNDLGARTDRRGTGVVRFTSFHLEDGGGRVVGEAHSGSDVCFVLGYRLSGVAVARNVDVGISIHTMEDQTLTVLYSAYVGPLLRLEASRGTLKCRIPHLPLAAGRYRLGARIVVNGEEADWPQNGVSEFEVAAGDFFGTGSQGGEGAASLLVNGRWEVGVVADGQAGV